MPITPLSGGTAGNEEWGDFSGGEILISISDPAYTSVHSLRVIPFDTAGTGLFTGAPGGSTTGLEQEAENLVALIKALFPASVTISAFAANQTLADHTGEVPYAFSFGAGATAVGTDANPRQSLAFVQSYNSRGADGSRWRLVMNGVSNDIAGASVGKTPFGGATGASLALINYLTRNANGPVFAVLSNVVTHNGVPILKSPGSVTDSFNKRLRRHFKLV